MADRWRWRALGLAHGPGEAWLVPAETFGEMLAEARREGAGGAEATPAVEPERLPLEHALALFDGSFRQTTFALRAFVRDNALGPSVSLLREHHLLSHLRQQIAVGALVAVRPGTKAPPRKRPSARRAPAPPAPAPLPIRRGPPPPTAPMEDERPEFMCPGPQAQALREAAAAGVPFCAECQRAAAARAAMGAT